MEKTRQYNIEGELLEIPLHYDELAGRDIEIFLDFIENPVYTPKGCPVLFTGEDACEYGEAPNGVPLSLIHIFSQICRCCSTVKPRYRLSSAFFGKSCFL